MTTLQEVVAQLDAGKTMTMQDWEVVTRAAVDPNTPDSDLVSVLLAIKRREDSGSAAYSPAEIADFISAAARSGTLLQAQSYGREDEIVSAGGHATGGVFETKTDLVSPLLVAAGVDLALDLSGARLGHTGGTLERHTGVGLKVYPSLRNLPDLAKRSDWVLFGQTPEICPADGRLYRLRDLNHEKHGLVMVDILITMSILSKKFASGLGALGVMVTFGSGGLAKGSEGAVRLGQMMADAGTALGMPTSCMSVDMSTPLGRMGGTRRAFAEACLVLTKESTSPDLLEVAMELASLILANTAIASDLLDARSKIRRAYESGDAVRVVERFLEAHGGNPRIVSNPVPILRSSFQLKVVAPQDGYYRPTAIEIGRILNEVLIGDFEANGERPAPGFDPSAGIDLLDELFAGEVKAGT
ncbi:MAG: hypothetical protein KDD53_09865, partial [Bdellovibrionales bacterium]|nr:hypothetical protein [Bdellovibrionales bacterium]